MTLSMRILTKNSRRISACLLICLFCVCIGAASLLLRHSTVHVPAVNGKADLRNVALPEGAVLQLKGTWEYFEEKLIVTGAMENPKPDGYVFVPSYTNSSKWGSYRLRLTNCPPEMLIAVALRGMPSASRVFVNGQCIEKSGLVSREAATKIEAGFTENSAMPLRSSDCEIVVEVSGKLFSGLSIAPVLMERSSYTLYYQRYQAAIFILVGVNLLFALAYAVGLGLTPRGGYSPKVFLAIFILLLQGLSLDPVFSVLCENSEISYDLIFLGAYLGRILMWPILLLWGYGSVKGERKSGVFYRLLAVTAGGMAAAPALNLWRETTAFWLLGDVCLLLTLIVCLMFSVRNHAIRQEAFLLQGGLQLLWLGTVIGDLAMAGLLPFFYRIAIPMGSGCFQLAIYVIDRRRVGRIQKKALEAVKTEMELEKAKTELTLHQIKPHFLHNALMSIKVLCRRNPAEAEATVYDFAVFLRSNMKAIESEAPIPFLDELKTIEGYLHIEQVRFGKLLQVKWDIREKDFMIPPLTVQPLVENAVRHGICQKPGGGTVTISTGRGEGCIWIEVQDDGVGFDVNTAESQGGIGIKNLRLRLDRLLHATLELYSEPGQGCRQIVKIPINGGKER